MRFYRVSLAVAIILSIGLSCNRSLTDLADPSRSVTALALTAEVTAFSVEPGSQSRGANVLLTIGLKANARVASGGIQVTFRHAGSGATLTCSQWRLRSGTRREGAWTCLLPMDYAADIGTYTVSQARIVYVFADGSSSWFEPALTATLNVKDIAEVVDFSMPAAVRAGGTMVLTIHLKSLGKTASQQIAVELIQPYDLGAYRMSCRRWSLVSGSRSDGLWRCRLEVPTGMPTGTYHTELAVAYVMPDNSTRWFVTTLPDTLTMLPIASRTYFSVEPRIVNAGRTIKMTVGIESSVPVLDDEIYIRYRRQSANGLFAFLVACERPAWQLVSGNTRRGRWECYTQVPEHAWHGEYGVDEGLVKFQTREGEYWWDIPGSFPVLRVTSPVPTP